MRELAGDLFSPPEDTHAICIPTNGIVYNHRAIMGAGVALEARTRFPEIDAVLGSRIERHGNHVHVLTHYDIGLIPQDLNKRVVLGTTAVPFHIVAFPTKSSWSRPGSRELITQSCRELRWLFPKDDLFDRLVVLPRVGCGLGKLSWEDVRPILQLELPEDRFVVLHKE